MRRVTNRGQDLETICVLGLALLGAALVTGRVGFTVAAAALLAVGATSRTLASLISHAWLTFSRILGAMSNRVILAAVFYALLTPIALISRLFTGDSLSLKRKTISGSLYRERNHKYSRIDFTKMW
jgi:hypothetical protein